MVKPPLLATVGMLCSLLLPGCGGQFLSPPAAEIGDAALTVTVLLKSSGRFPSGADVVITLADISGYVPSPLAGDKLNLTEGDRSIRVTLPADKEKIGRCQTAGICGIFVRVTKSGKTLYQNAQPVPYTLQNKNVTVPVQAAS